MCPVRDPSAPTHANAAAWLADELLGAFQRELRAVSAAVTVLQATSQECRMHLGFRITALVDALTTLAERAVSAPHGRSVSRTDLVERLITSTLLTSGEAHLLARWLLRHHAVSVFILQATCIRWSREIQQDAAALEGIAGRLSASSQAAEGGATAM